MLLTEDHKHDFGCLMAVVSPQQSITLINFIHKMIDPSILYKEPGDSGYGYENEPHVTIKYGFIPDLSPANVNQIIAGVKPFNVVLTGLTQFNTDKYDVVKFDVQSIELNKMRKLADKFPNKDEFPVYRPHMTCAYVNKGSFKFKKDKIRYSVTITKFKYSGRDGKEYYINI